MSQDTQQQDRKRPIEEPEERPPKKPKLNTAPDAQNPSGYERLTRTRFFLAVCELLRQKSSDPYFKVGCCLVRSDTREMQSIGYNGFLVGENNDPEVWKAKSGATEEVREDYLQHAETNAIHFAKESDLVDTVAYVSCLPCKNCCAKLIQKRVPAVVYNISQQKYIQPSKDAFALEYTCCTLPETCICLLIGSRSFNDIEPEGQEVCIKLEGYDNPKKDWEVLFMAIAVLASQRCEATVPSKEGCVIVHDKQILGYGYSGYPQLMMKKPDSLADFPTITAIQNALCFTTNVAGATVYCTHFPTHEAFKELIQRGVSVVKYLHGPNKEITDVLLAQLSPAESAIQQDYRKVLKLAIKNPISLRVFGKGASRNDTDTTNLNMSVDAIDGLTLDAIRVTTITIEEADRQYKKDCLTKDVNIKIPPLQDSRPKEDMKEWLNSPESIRYIKRINSTEKEVRTSKEPYVPNTPFKTK